MFEPFQVTAGSVPDALEKVRTFHGSVYPEPSGHVFTVYAPWGTGQNHPWSVMLVEATSKADPFSIQAVYRVSAVDAFALPPPGSPKYVEPTGPPRIWQRDDVTHKPMAARVPIKPDAESHPGPAPGLSDLMRVESSKPGPPK